MLAEGLASGWLGPRSECVAHGRARASSPTGSRFRFVAFSPRLLSMFPGGLNRPTQHSILKGKDGVFGNASRLFSRLYGIGENRALGSLAAGRVAESDWTSVW